MSRIHNTREKSRTFGGVYGIFAEDYLNNNLFYFGYNMGVVWKYHHWTKNPAPGATRSLYIDTVHYGPLFEVKIRISDHSPQGGWFDEKAKLPKGKFVLDMRFGDSVPETEEGIFELLRFQHPDRCEELDLLWKEVKRLDAAFVTGFGPETKAQDAAIEVKGAFNAADSIDLAEKWWDGPTGFGFEYRTIHRGCGYIISRCSNGRKVAVIWTSPRCDSARRALISALENRD